MRLVNRISGLILSVLLTISVGIGTSLAREEAIANGAMHQGVEVTADLPNGLRIKNTGGSDGAGLCVWASATMMAHYLNVEELFDLFDWMKSQPGGGWPERVDKIMKDRAPTRVYKQNMSKTLDFVQEGIDSGRPVCITYGYGEIYGSATIAHMVLCVHLDEKWGAVLDNNEPGVIRWMSRAELEKRAGHPSGEIWSWYILASPPPPPPHN